MADVQLTHKVYTELQAKEFLKVNQNTGITYDKRLGKPVDVYGGFGLHSTDTPTTLDDWSLGANAITAIQNDVQLEKDLKEALSVNLSTEKALDDANRINEAWEVAQEIKSAWAEGVKSFGTKKDISTYSQGDEVHRTQMQNKTYKEYGASKFDINALPGEETTALDFYGDQGKSEQNIKIAEKAVIDSIVADDKFVNYTTAEKIATTESQDIISDAAAELAMAQLNDASALEIAALEGQLQSLTENLDPGTKQYIVDHEGRNAVQELGYQNAIKAKNLIEEKRIEKEIAVFEDELEQQLVNDRNLEFNKKLAYDQAISDQVDDMILAAEEKAKDTQKSMDDKAAEAKAVADALALEKAMAEDRAVQLARINKQLDPIITQVEETQGVNVDAEGYSVGVNTLDGRGVESGTAITANAKMTDELKRQQQERHGGEEEARKAQLQKLEEEKAEIAASGIQQSPGGDAHFQGADASLGIQDSPGGDAHFLGSYASKSPGGDDHFGGAFASTSPGGDDHFGGAGEAIKAEERREFEDKIRAGLKKDDERLAAIKAEEANKNLSTLGKDADIRKARADAPKGIVHPSNAGKVKGDQLAQLKEERLLKEKYDTLKEKIRLSKIKPVGAINHFIASMSSSGGYARPNKYEVVFHLPEMLMGKYDTRQLTMHCDTISWPGHDLQTQSVKKASEPEKQFVQSHAFAGTISATFYLDVKHSERFLFEQWQELAVNRYTHKANYYKDYIGSMEMYQLSTKAKQNRSAGPHSDLEKLAKFESERTYGIEVFDVYPATISATEYAYIQAETVQLLTVSFNYREHLPITITDENKRPIV